MKLHILFISIITLFFTACSIKPLEPITFETVNKEISFANDIKPILDKRCVSCHSCYNSPCQLKLSSYEGLERGASKANVYANRITADNPTRLFVDAVNEKEWREKGFFSMTDFLKESNESVMMRYLFQKNLNPLNLGEYSPETDELTCSKDKNELAKFFDENPHKGMPYGFPALKKDEYNLLMTWLNQGAKNDEIKKETQNDLETAQIKKFEEFLNKKDTKHKVTARYIYEHLFLAHITFDEKSGNFYELIRSKTPSGETPQIIPTRFPYDEVKEPFYYRFQKITSTIVHKTHMVYKLDDKKLERYNELFIKPNWDIKPYLPSYDSSISANALKTFEQIPASSRYQFLLDDIEYIIMTFIRGPVCKGQIALNVINDHFWVMFMDPKFDLSLQDKYFLHDNIPNLSIPNEYGEDPSLFKTFRVIDNYELSKQYHTNRAKIYKQYFPKGLPMEAIWKGNEIENDSILTIYMHFDSASVHKGALGDIPKTLWVIDYPLLERIYYSLVAGFDIFGNTAHQLLVRTHMDRLRIEGESNFLEFLPKESRVDYFNSWYEGWLAQYLSVYIPSNNNVDIKYQTNNFKNEFVNKLFTHTNMKKDSINFIEKGYKKSEIKESYSTKEEIEETFKTLTLPNSSEIIKHFTDDKSNLAYIRIKMNSGESLTYTLVINRWHKNVALLFDEESRLDPTKDRINFIKGFIGSYPNFFVEVEQNDLNDFFNLIQNYKDTPSDNLKVGKYVINRANPNFWEVFDWFDNEFKKQDSLQYGLFDLNRYYSKARNP